MENTQDLLPLITRAGLHLSARQMKVCTAESCTGGWLAQALTMLPGSSEWFDCGFVTYSNIAKQNLLQVPEEIIAAHGAVSEACAIAMAQGALALSAAEISVAITGIAGPTGVSESKPLGMVWLAWHVRAGDTITRCEYFKGDRHAVRKQAVSAALEMILRL